MGLTYTYLGCIIDLFKFYIIDTRLLEDYTNRKSNINIYPSVEYTLFECHIHTTFWKDILI